MRARRLTTRSAQLIVAALVAAVPLSVSGSSVLAEDRQPPGLPGDDSDGYVDPDGDPTVVVTEDGTPDTPVTVPGDTDAEGRQCWWEVVIADDTVTKAYGMGGARRYSATGRWLMNVCEGIGPVAINGVPIVPEGGRVIPGELAQEAAASIPIPAPQMVTSPASGRLIVQVPTWLWIDGGWWEPYSATASTGRVSATVTATPVRVVWSTGDGATVACAAGVAWQPGIAEDATDCAYTYTTASGDAGFVLSAVVEIELAWTSNIGESGTLDPITRTGTQTVQVGEIQAIGTR